MFQSACPPIGIVFEKHPASCVGCKHADDRKIGAGAVADDDFHGLRGDGARRRDVRSTESMASYWLGSENNLRNSP
jgi:hypothetical protein